MLDFAEVVKMKKPDEEKLLPDKFVLDKDEMIDCFNSISKFWQRDDLNKIENAAYVANMSLIKTAIRLNSSKVLGHLYFSIINAVHEIETLNTLKLSFQEAPEDLKNSFETLYSIEKEKITKGDCWIEN